jgi:CRP/FNR family transcriptional regulator, nitrogen fixation regulation protein
MLRLRGQYPVASANPKNETIFEVQSQGTFLKFLKGEIVYDQGDPATHWYEVISGTVRTCFLYSSGHRQLTGFFYAGDVFGIELGTHQSSAEAVTNLVLRRIDRGCQPEETVSRHTPAHANAPVCAPKPGASAAISSATLSDGVLQSALSNAQACIFLLGHRTAPERMAAFLLSTLRRMGGGKAVQLPMSRSDIADYLGLTIHTVSRTLSDFVRRRLITLDGPQSVQILDRHGLMRMAGRAPEDNDIPQPCPVIPPPANQNHSGLRHRFTNTQTVFAAAPRN